jgi:translation initiation factor IF-2
MRQQAEAAAEAAKAAEQAKQQAAAQAKAQPAPREGYAAQEARCAGQGCQEGRQRRADDGKKKPGIKTRSADPGSSWKSGRHGHKKHGQASDDGQGSFQAPTEIIVREIHVPETISVPIWPTRWRSRPSKSSR